MTEKPPTRVRVVNGAIVFSRRNVDLEPSIPISSVNVDGNLDADQITDATSLGRTIIRDASASGIRSSIAAEDTGSKGQPNGYVPLTKYGEVSSIFADDIVGDAVGEAITFAIFQLGD